MKKLLSITVSIFLLVSIVSCSAVAAENETENTLTVAVGIVPEATFVEAVAGELVDIVTMVPPGNSPANYQPTATEMQQLSDSAIYFTLQMPTEHANILPKVSEFSKDVKIVDLKEAIAAVYPLLDLDVKSHGKEGGSIDPHVWLSIKNAVVMVQIIADELAAVDAENADTYQANAADYIAELEALDGEIQEQLSGLTSRVFLIYHPAYGYFARDYDLTMLNIEIEGKQATAEELQSVIEKAKEENIKMVFYQAEFDDNQAIAVAEEIGGTVRKAAPLNPDYMQGLKDFANALTAQSEE